MDQSDFAVLSISRQKSVSRARNSRFRVTPTPTDVCNDRQADRRHHLPELWTKCNLVEKSNNKRSQRGDSQRSVRVLRTRTTCGATDSIFACEAEKFWENPMCYTTMLKGQKAVLICDIGDAGEYQW